MAPVYVGIVCFSYLSAERLPLYLLTGKKMNTIDIAEIFQIIHTVLVSRLTCY
jgi:hypothetical protein